MVSKELDGDKMKIASLGSKTNRVFVASKTSNIRELNCHRENQATTGEGATTNNSGGTPLSVASIMVYL